MGVPGFFAWLLSNSSKIEEKIILNKLENKKNTNTYLMLDTNCLLHPCAQEIIAEYKQSDKSREEIEELIWIKITSYIDLMIDTIKPTHLYVAIDGSAPMSKIQQQRQRRYKYLYDLTKIYTETKIDDNKHLPKTSIELTPGTEYMERIHKNMITYIKSKTELKYIYSSYHDPGEGEHKILQYIKQNNLSQDKKNKLIIYGLDADLLFLALSININKQNYDNIFIMREAVVFNKNNNNELFNYVSISSLGKLITSYDISVQDFILLSYLVGNDFLPRICGLDIKKKGLDKIIDAYKKSNINNELLVNVLEKDIIINHELLKSIFSKLIWTEKYFGTLQDKDKDNNNKSEYQEIIKFNKGETQFTTCFTKFKPTNSLEYYNHYLDIKCIELNIDIIQNMVKEYLKGIIWVAHYYFIDCISYEYCYKYAIPPLLEDIVKYYPNIDDLVIQEKKCEILPIEQLILAVPKQLYSYILDKDVIDDILNIKEIGYMLTNTNNIEINKESIYWKSELKIPYVELNEYLRYIKPLKLEIKTKHKILTNIKN